MQLEYLSLIDSLVISQSSPFMKGGLTKIHQESQQMCLPTVHSYLWPDAISEFRYECSGLMSAPFDMPWKSIFFDPIITAMRFYFAT